MNEIFIVNVTDTHDNFTNPFIDPYEIAFDDAAAAEDCANYYQEQGYAVRLTTLPVLSEFNPD